MRLIAPRRGQAGFTLIELMMVVVIVGILAAVAYPSYQEYVRRAQRSEAKALLSDIAARMERYYFDNNSYTTDLTDLGFASGSPESAEGHYSAGAAAGGSGDIATSYTLTVTRIGTLDDPKCGDLTLDSRGVKDASGSGGVEACW